MSDDTVKLMEMDTRRTVKGLVIELYVHEDIVSVFQSDNVRQSEEWCDEDKEYHEFYLKDYSDSLSKILSDYYDEFGRGLIVGASGAKKDDVEPNIAMFRTVGLSDEKQTFLVTDEQHSEECVISAQEKLKDLCNEIYDELVRGFTAKCRVNKGETL